MVGKVEEIAEGINLIVEGAETKSLFFVTKGQLGIFKRRGNKEVSIAHVKAGEIVGEMSFFEKTPRCASVRALTACTVLEVPTENFEKFFFSQPDWHQKMVITILKRIRNMNTKNHGE